MSSIGLSETDVEIAALEWLKELGWHTVHGPEIGPDQASRKRADHRAMVLDASSREASAQINPMLPSEAMGNMERELVQAL